MGCGLTFHLCRRALTLKAKEEPQKTETVFVLRFENVVSPER